MSDPLKEYRCPCGAVLKTGVGGVTGAQLGRHARSKRHQVYARLDYERRRKLRVGEA
jgi:hypothetical protein